MIGLPRGYDVVPTTDHEDPHGPGATFALVRYGGFELCYFTGNANLGLVADLARADERMLNGVARNSNAFVAYATEPRAPLAGEYAMRDYREARREQLRAFEALYERGVS